MRQLTRLWEPRTMCLPFQRNAHRIWSIFSITHIEFVGTSYTRHLLPHYWRLSSPTTLLVHIAQNTLYNMIAIFEQPSQTLHANYLEYTS